jgi:hypothetical protein
VTIIARPAPTRRALSAEERAKIVQALAEALAETWKRQQPPSAVHPSHRTNDAPGDASHVHRAQNIREGPTHVEDDHITV